jgi:hypothetical protein
VPGGVPNNEGRRATIITAMGEASQKRSTTQKFIAEFPECCFCGGLRPATTREHMPPKSLFDDSHRPDKLIMPACDECNQGTSTADLAVATVSRWNYNSGPQERLDHRKLSARGRRQAPELIEEWTSLRNDPIKRAGARRHLIEHGVPVPDDAGLTTVGPLTIRQLNLFAHKAILALYFEHFRRPLSNAGRFCAFWRSKEDFVRDGIPSIFFEMLPKYGTLIQGHWNERETFEYRHDINVDEGLFGCFARFRQGFFVFGFAATNASVLPPDDLDWIKPSELLALPDNPRFVRKH